MAIRLRYLAHDLEVPEGHFIIGRTAGCQLSLDDPLVSRRHALLTVRDDTAVIEDLGSRNGVLVNGARIEGAKILADGDVIKIGSQEITLSGVAETPVEAIRAHTLQRMMTLTDEKPEAHLDEQSTVGMKKIGEEAKPDAPDKRIHALSLIGGLADKAFALGRAEEAERLLARPLAEQLEKAVRGEVIARDLVEAATSYSLRVAEVTSKGRWVDYVFELWTALGWLLPARVVDELYVVVRHVKHSDRASLRAYLERVKRDAASFGPAERFVLQRLESLERWA